MKRCKCEHWQQCPVCMPHRFDGEGKPLPPEPTPLQAARNECESLRELLAQAEINFALEHDDKLELEQQLAHREAQIVMLREALERVRGHGRLYNLFSCVGSDSYDPECADLNAQKCRKIAEEALAATDDLSGFVLCEKEPVATASVGQLATVEFSHGIALRSLVPPSGKSMPLYRARSTP